MPDREGYYQARIGSVWEVVRVGINSQREAMYLGLGVEVYRIANPYPVPGYEIKEWGMRIELPPPPYQE